MFSRFMNTVSVFHRRPGMLSYKNDYLRTSEIVICDRDNHDRHPQDTDPDIQRRQRVRIAEALSQALPSDIVTLVEVADIDPRIIGILGSTWCSSVEDMTITLRTHYDTWQQPQWDGRTYSLTIAGLSLIVLTQ